mmetsp:Transcript_7280/g.14926  ORF Transcript_7280/g.14926 Transcript_7280/m.14926 type:complete len:223 (+) Transcript_7280:3718-4386(+)
MGLRKQKVTRKGMAFYRVHFGIKEPYSVICDGTIIHFALQKQLFLKDALPRLLSAPSHVCVTRCITAELRSLGEEFSGAAVFARRAQHVACAHSPDSIIPATDCIIALAESNATHSLCFATRDPQIQRQLGRLSGVPLIYVNNTALVLHRPSNESNAEIVQREQDKLHVGLSESTYIRKTRRHLRRLTRKEREHVTSRKKKKPAKGPNPLSVKKKNAKRKDS